MNDVWKYFHTSSFCKIRANKFRSYECIKKAFTKYTNSKWYEAVERFPTLAPLYKLLQKKTNWQWGPEQQAAFSKAKQSLISDCLAGTLTQTKNWCWLAMHRHMESELCCHATMNMIHLMLLWTYVNTLRSSSPFNILYSTYKYTVFCTKFHVCFGVLSRKLIYS